MSTVPHPCSHYFAPDLPTDQGQKVEILFLSPIEVEFFELFFFFFSIKLDSFCQQFERLDLYFEFSIISYILCKLHVIELYDGHPPVEKKF
jgi:hypothetical protein